MCTFVFLLFQKIAFILAVYTFDFDADVLSSHPAMLSVFIAWMWIVTVYFLFGDSPFLMHPSKTACIHGSVASWHQPASSLGSLLSAEMLSTGAVFRLHTAPFSPSPKESAM